MDDVVAGHATTDPLPDADGDGTVIESDGAHASAETAVVDAGDERLAYRGLFGRLLVRPDIGALIGVVTIWVFFWAVSIPFGTANGATTVLDVSSTLGIMAVAVAVLMIGGEFDLSSGANTGAMGILVIMFVKETGEIGGLGLHYWLAIPLSLIVALGIGWANGWMVERLALPSFIATLATFFVLRGAKLGFSKRIVDQIQVGRADEGAGYERWQNFFAATWERNLHQFQARDLLYLVFIVAGFTLVALAIFEFSFRVRDGASELGLTGFVLTIAGAVGVVAWREWQSQDNTAIEALEDTWATFSLQGSDHISFLGQLGEYLTWTNLFYLVVAGWLVSTIRKAVAGRAIGATAQSIGLILGAVAVEAAIRRRPTVLVFVALAMLVLGMAMFVAGELRRKPDTRTAGALAALAGAAAIVFGVRGMHYNEGLDWGRGVIIGFGGLALALGLAFWRYETHRERGPLRLNGSVLLSLGLGVVLLVGGYLFASLLDAEADTQIWFFFTEQGLRAMLFGAFTAAGMVWMLIAVARSGRISPMAKSLTLTMSALAVFLIALAIRSESASPKFRAELFGILCVVALLMFAWAVTGLLFQDRTSLDESADRSARWIATLGVLGVSGGLLVKLLYTMQYEFTRERPITPAILSVRTLWFVAFTALCAWVLGRTKWGSWVYAVGGNKQAARQVGVPAARTKTQLFMLVSFAAWLVGMLLAFRLNTIQASTGNGLEFEYIIAAVVGGTFLTGGYGTVVGAALGAVIMAISKQGIPFSGWNSDWRFVFLGVILLLAVVANGFIRQKAEAAR